MSTDTTDARLRSANPLPDLDQIDVVELAEVRNALLASPPAGRRRRRRLRGGTVAALGVLLIGVPTAAAVRSALDSSGIAFSVPPPPAAAPGSVPGDDRPGWVLDEGQTDGLFWTIAAASCSSNGADGLRVLALTGSTPRTGTMSISGCSPTAAGGVPAPATSRTRGLTLLYGIVPDAARTVEFTLFAYDQTSRPETSDSRTVTVTTEPFPVSALAPGRLPAGYRVFKTQAGPNDLQIQSATVKDASGTVLLECTAASCRPS